MKIFNVGDKVWIVNAGRRSHFIECPDCLGTKRLRFIPADGKEVLIECRGCQSGYPPAQGVVQAYEWEAKATEIRIDGIELGANREGETVAKTYNFNMSGGAYRSEEGEKVFATKAEAEKNIEALVKEFEEGEARRINHKLKDHKSWAWHVHYHRKEIRRAKETIERSEEMLGYALVKAEKAKKKGKEPK